jgi:hypothetical protein
MPGCCGPGAPQSALVGSYGVYEGAFASVPVAWNLETRAPFRSVTAGPTAWRSNSPGTAQGRFGWGNSATGLVNNTRLAASDAIGVVIPFRSLNGANGGVVGGPRGIAGGQASWTWEFWDPTVTPCGGLRVRPGLVVTLHARGNFWLRFAGGAIYGDPVYASLVDGSAVSGSAANCELTPWLVCSTTPPGQLCPVSTAAIFTP